MVNPLAWAFQKDSELVGVFNYHIHRMMVTGNIDRFWQVIDRQRKENKDAAKMLTEIRALGYEDVSLPFLALLTGLFAAFLLLLIEILTPSNRKGLKGAYQYNDEDFSSSEAREIIEETYGLLLENQSILKETKIISKIKEIRDILAQLPVGK